MTRHQRRVRRSHMAAEVEKGALLTEVAEKFGVHASTVGRACQSLDIKPRGQQRLLKQRKDATRDRNRAIQAERRHGHTHSDIARRYGLSRQRVAQICRDG